jgi:hypothetical protein
VTSATLPPLPAPRQKDVTETVEIVLPADVMDDLKSRAHQDGVTLDVAVALCVMKWRAGDAPQRSARGGRRKAR